MRSVADVDVERDSGCSRGIERCHGFFVLWKAGRGLIELAVSTYHMGNY